MNGYPDDHAGRHPDAGPKTRPAADGPHVLAVNPWIHDFAAYDFWAKPLGLLTLAAALRQCGFRVSYLDCLDRFHPQAACKDHRKRFGRGPFTKTPLPKPAGLEAIPRRFSRYGIPLDEFERRLKRLSPPDLILVAGTMTYWYPGVRETIDRLRGHFPDTPLMLGGVYPTLCPEHARRCSGADEIWQGPLDRRLLARIGRITGGGVAEGVDLSEPARWPYPALDLQPRIGYVPLLTGRGCPLDCDYCASRIINPEWSRRRPEAVLSEIVHWSRRYGVADFAFYDDALLMDAENHILPLLEQVVRRGLAVRFHTPNALHIRWIGRDVADLMARSGFETVRLGLETADFSDGARRDRKVAAADFARAVAHLKAAGFRRRQVGAYLLAGLPGQTFEAVAESVAVVKKTGVQPILAYYSPIPGTRLWAEAVAASPYPLEAEPVFTNNAIFPCWPDAFARDLPARLKALAR